MPGRGASPPPYVPRSAQLRRWPRLPSGSGHHGSRRPRESSSLHLPPVPPTPWRDSTLALIKVSLRARDGCVKASICSATAIKKKRSRVFGGEQQAGRVARLPRPSRASSHPSWSSPMPSSVSDPLNHLHSSSASSDRPIPGRGGNHHHVPAGASRFAGTGSTRSRRRAGAVFMNRSPRTKTTSASAMSALRPCRARSPLPTRGWSEAPATRAGPTFDLGRPATFAARNDRQAPLIPFRPPLRLRKDNGGHELVEATVGDSSSARRRCQYPECTTTLSAYNPDRLCWMHGRAVVFARLERWAVTRERPCAN